MMETSLSWIYFGWSWEGQRSFFWFTGETVPWLAQVESQLNPTVGSDLWVQIDKIDQLNWTFLDDILLG